MKLLIKNFTPQPYDGTSQLPDYVTGVRSYTLEADVPGDYRVTFARLTVGESVSAGNPLTHVLFESFDDHGNRRKTARTRAGGYDREFIAVRNAMTEAGVEFLPALSCSCDVILAELGKWLQAQNIEVCGLSVHVVGVSQTCH